MQSCIVQLALIIKRIHVLYALCVVLINEEMYGSKLYAFCQNS